MKDPEIQAFGQRILVWTKKMQPLTRLTEQCFAVRKHRIQRGEEDENQYEPGSDAAGNDNGAV